MQQPAPANSGADLCGASWKSLSLSLCSVMMSSTRVMYSKDNSTPRNCKRKGSSSQSSSTAYLTLPTAAFRDYLHIHRISGQVRSLYTETHTVLLLCIRVINGLFLQRANTVEERPALCLRALESLGGCRKRGLKKTPCKTKLTQQIVQYLTVMLLSYQNAYQLRYI